LLSVQTSKGYDQDGSKAGGFSNKPLRI